MTALPVPPRSASPKSSTIVTSAPAKIILFGEHGVNRQQPALATAVDLRLFCRVKLRADDRYLFRSGSREEATDRAGLLAFKAKIDALREVVPPAGPPSVPPRGGEERGAEALDEIRRQAQDFFAPTRYVLAHVVERVGGPGLEVEWRSTLPIGAGLGSGAAASAALALAAWKAAGYRPEPGEVAFMAWQGDIIAHGGVASGLDSGACALGGLTRYTLAAGPELLPRQAQSSLPIVIGDTLVQANTAEVNTHVRTWLTAHPARRHLFAEMGLLVQHALAALAADDLTAVGHLMNLNQLLLEKLGVSCPEIERLVEAALSVGALGAKLSGSGGGGIIIALTEPGRQSAVAEAIETAGGRSLVTVAGAPGVRVEPEEIWANQPE
jgi:mevalonate kinase